MNRNAVKKASAVADEPIADWHPADIKAALHKAGWTLTALAKEHGLTSQGTLSKAFTSSYPVAEKRIADALGIHPRTIWPTRYFDSGEPKPRGLRGLYLNRITPAVNGNFEVINNHENA
jgi:lambda repressor-like predicted transcriptional regulator